jgi:hypothetical protein
LPSTNQRLGVEVSSLRILNGLFIIVLILGALQGHIVNMNRILKNRAIDSRSFVSIFTDRYNISKSWSNGYAYSWYVHPVNPLVEFIRSKLREEGFMRRILPPKQISS